MGCLFRPPPGARGAEKKPTPATGKTERERKAWFTLAYFQNPERVGTPAHGTFPDLIQKAAGVRRNRRQTDYFAVSVFPLRRRAIVDRTVTAAGVLIVDRPSNKIMGDRSGRGHHNGQGREKTAEATEVSLGEVRKPLEIFMSSYMNSFLARTAQVFLRTGFLS